MGDRHFKNPYRDYEGQDYLDSHGELDAQLTKRIGMSATKLLTIFDHELEHGGVDWDDYSVYTGTAGYALLHMKLYEENGAHASLRTALHFVERPLRHMKKKRISFLCGDAGPLALGAVLYKKMDRHEHSKDCIERLVALHKKVTSDPELPDELLFGRVGYLYSLLYVNKYLGHNTINQTLINKVYDRVIQSGVSMSKRDHSPCPLMYAWHDKIYLGAAHGLVGILYILMMVDGPQYKSVQEELIKPTIDYLMTLRFPSGNFPSSLGSSSGDKLVHWCHGAPGWIHLFIKAHSMFGDQKYLQEAKSCAEVLWTRGVLHKRYGLCHGVAGNGYGLLALYKHTHDQIYLHRALKFAEWCDGWGSRDCRTPDRPWSLFEGLSGTIHFLLDLQRPQSALMPAFEL